MKLRAIDRSQREAALVLLAAGFPAKSLQEWEFVLEKLLAYSEDRFDGVIGQIAGQKGQDIGICLTIPGQNSAYEEEARKVVNVAAFHMVPGTEWMTTLFMRRLMADSSVDYTDLTASHSMRDINRRLGFVDLSEGMIVVPTPAVAFHPGAQGLRLVPFNEAGDIALSPAHRQLLEDHQGFDCSTFVVVENDIAHPLILAPVSRKGLPGARVVLARDRALVHAIIGPLARSMMLAGKTYIEFDGTEADMMPGAVFRASAAPVQATRRPTSNAIDYCYCEFAFIPPSRFRAAIRIYERKVRAEVYGMTMQASEVAISHPATGVALKVAEISGL